MHLYSINGLPMERWRVRRGTTVRTDISTRRSSVVVPGMHGHIAAGMITNEAPLLTLQLRPLLPPEQKSSKTLDDFADDLRALIGSPRLTIRRDFSGVIAEAEAALVSHTWDVSEFMCGRTERVNVTLEVPGVFWRGLDWVTKTIPAGSSVVFDDSTAPIVDAVVSFAGSAADPMLTDVVSGTGLGFIGTPGGNAAFVDAGTMQAWAGSAADWELAGSDLNSSVDYPGAGILQLWPTPGTAADWESDAPTPLGDLTWAEAAMTWGEADEPWGEPSGQHAPLQRGFRVRSTHAATIRFRRAYL